MEMKEMMQHHHQSGRVEWIGIRPSKRADVQVVLEVDANAESGLSGDHYSGQSGNRHVTLIQSEHLDVIGKIMSGSAIDPSLPRRNIVVSGINLLSLKEQKVSIGSDVVIEVTGDCHPCSRMEENLGYGGYNAMRGMGGVTARILQSGKIRVGDSIKLS